MGRGMGMGRGRGREGREVKQRCKLGVQSYRLAGWHFEQNEMDDSFLLVYTK